MGTRLPGYYLRELRAQAGLTLSEVEHRSRRLAEAKQNPEFLITATRLSQLENIRSLPSLFKLASLSVIYKVPISAFLHAYGIDVSPSEPEEKAPEMEKEAA